MKTMNTVGEIKIEDVIGLNINDISQHQLWEIPIDKVCQRFVDVVSLYVLKKCQ